LVLAAGCHRSERTTGPRPSQPTLTVAPKAQTETGRRVVAAAQIAQQWHVGSWSPASITLSAVEGGDAIVVLGVYWGDLPRDAVAIPTDDRGTLVRVLDQGPAVLGKVKPPVFAQLYVELDAAPGSHTIVPPYLGGPAGDGTFYVVQLRGLTEHRVVATGERRQGGLALGGVEVALEGAAVPGDLVIALAGYDNTKPIEHAGWLHPAGHKLIAAQDDAANNVPSSLCSRLEESAGPRVAKWTWSDPTVNVASALVAAFR
jgi:hypothetical protein